MKIYLDFEATSPENEIIAIGAVAETGATFYSLVKPQLSTISPYISQLTHIKPSDLENAKNISEVLQDFNEWVMKRTDDIMACRFISYGDDSAFIKHTLPAIKDIYSFSIAAVLMAKMEDCYEEMKKFFHGSIKLIHAFNYVQEVEAEQTHNPLDDAKMLQKVYEYTEKNEPLHAHPLSDVVKEHATYNSPRGYFACRSLDKNAKERHFNTCEEAMDWLIKNVVHAQDPSAIHRDRMMGKIMKAVRTRTPYCGFRWRRF